MRENPAKSNYGIIRDMPSRRETPDITAAAERARSMFAAPSRLAVARYLMSHSPATPPEIVQATGISVAGCRLVLEQLLSDGYVTKTGIRPGYYTAVRELITDDTTALVSWLLR